MWRPYNPGIIEKMRARMSSAAGPVLDRAVDKAVPHDPNLTPDEMKNERDKARRREAADRSRKQPGFDIPTGPQVPNLDPVVTRPGFESYPGAISEAAAATRGLGRIFTSHGRQEIRDARERRGKKRTEVAEYIADRVLNPRGSSVNPRDKLGWVGTNKVFQSGIPNMSGPPDADAGKVGDDMMKPNFKPLGPPEPPKSTTPNDLRPVTWGEKRDDRSIGAQAEKMRVARSKSNWLQRSYDDMLSARSGARLSYSERRLMGKTSKRAERAMKKAERARAKIRKISGV
jgi:hypothetical protein